MGTLVLTRGEDLGGVLGAGSPDGEAAILELRSDLLLHRFAAACSLHSRGQSVSGGRRAGDQDQGAWGERRGKGGEGSGEQSEAGWRRGGKWRDEMAGNISGGGGARVSRSVRSSCRLHLVGLVGPYPTCRYVSAHVSIID